uniref:Uncharacterized protein n=1 Tax=Rhizophora mucronata TaxID=61149 RepID=A0A2P2P3F8_RHIMU
MGNCLHAWSHHMHMHQRGESGLDIINLSN